MLIGIMASSICVTDFLDVSYSPDPDDNKIIATAISGQANYIVTGDKRDLLELNQVENISIITAHRASKMFHNS